MYMYIVVILHIQEKYILVSKIRTQSVQLFPGSQFILLCQCLIYSMQDSLTFFIDWIIGMMKDGTIMAKKHRKIGGYSNTKPPADAPEWTVDVQWKQQQGTSMAELGSAGELFGQSSPPPLAL